MTAIALTLVLLVGVVAATTNAQEADLVSLQADPAQWVMPNGNYAAWNYSPLDQITLENVGDLSLAWTLPLPILDAHQAAPLVVGDTMYIVTPKPNRVYAIDLARDGVVKWEFRAELEDLELVTQRACCGAKTRGLGYADGKVFFNTLDGQVIALDASTGEVVWQDDPTDYPVSEVRTGAPLIVGRNVIFGVSGGDRGVRGHVTAHDIDTGELRWRYYNLGPNQDVGIGPRFQPFYADDKVANPALDSWFGDSWRLGGGAVWGWFSYDSELNYFYYGTGNCGPWNPDYRREPGVIGLDEHGGVSEYRNNYCASLLARDATTGELIWAYNVTPQDQWDLDEVSAAVLVDLEIGGEMRRALIRASRNGFFYVLDRATGELLAEPWAFAPNDIISRIDMETGRPSYNLDKIQFTDLEDRQRYVPEAENTNVPWCPGISARNWQNDAYSHAPDCSTRPRRTGAAPCVSSRASMCRGNATVSARAVARQNLHPWVITPTSCRPTILSRAEPPGAWNGRPPTTPRSWLRPATWSSREAPIRGCSAPSTLVLATSPGSSGPGLVSRARPYRTWGPDGRQYIAIVGSSPATDPQVALDTPEDAVTRFRLAGTILYVFALPTHP